MGIKIAVLFGGKSVEHEISVISAVQAMKSLNAEKYDVIPVYITKNNQFYFGEDLKNIEEYKDINALLKKCRRVILLNDEGKVKAVEYPFKMLSKKSLAEIDIAFPITHGTNVEDGVLQGYLKTLDLPFVGCDVLSSAVGMDKHIMKVLLKDNGVPVLDDLLFTLADYANLPDIISAVQKKFSFPVIVKPVNLGSSIGISKAADPETLESALNTAFTFAERVIVERAVVELREINCSVLGDSDEAKASECEEPIGSDEILSYSDKYMNNSKGSGSKGMATLKRKIPAELTPEMKELIQSIAVKAFKTLNCCGVSRIDFLIDESTNEIWLNEINTIPGSLSFYLWEATGTKYPELLDKLISLALKRQRREENLTHSFDTNILSLGSFSGKK